MFNYWGIVFNEATDTLSVFVFYMYREISRLSNFGTLTLSPNTMPVRRTRADAFLDVSQNKEQPRSAAVAMLQKTLK